MSTCWITPRLSTATRSPSVIASVWSWVTYSVVTPSRWCSFTSSARICTRSFASRFESGSSMRNDGGMAHDRAAHRDTLALAARERAGLALEQLADPEQLGRVLDPPPPLVLGEVLHPQREADVVANRHVRVQRVVLEHHRDVAVDGVEVVDDLAADQDLARGRVLETRHHPQRRRLAAARRPDEDHELAVVDLQVEVVDGDGAVAEPLRHPLERDPGHLGEADDRLDVGDPHRSRRRRTAAGASIAASHHTGGATRWRSLMPKPIPVGSDGSTGRFRCMLTPWPCTPGR